MSDQGARVDVGSHHYSYSFEPSTTWSEYFCRQPELQRYFEHVVDKFELHGKSEEQPRSGFRGLFTAVSPERKQVIDPPEWAAFSLMSVGTVTMLYSVALPKKPA